MSRTLPSSVRNAINSRRAFLSRGLSAQPRNRAADAVARVLSARRFHPRVVRALARRHYADAANVLLRGCRVGDRHQSAAIIPLLLEPWNGRLTAYRAAVCLGALSANQTENKNCIDLDDVRALATGGEEVGERARVALALIGRPLKPWPDLSRAERAAFTLNRLVAAFRNRGAS